MKFASLILFALAASAASAQPQSASDSSPATTALAQRLAKPYRAGGENIRTVLTSLARSYKFTVVIAPDVKGDVQLEINDGTVRDVLNALTEPNGFFYEESENFVSVKKLRTVLYTIEYPKVSRSASASTAVSMSPGSGSSGSSNSNGQNTVTTNNTANGQNGQTGGGGNTGSSSFQITQKNENDVWTDLSSALKSYLLEDEKLVLNPFSGIASITAAVQRHRDISAFISKLNRRIRRQVLIEAKFVQIDTNTAFKFGADYSLAATKAGIFDINNTAIMTKIAGVGSTVLPQNTLVTTLGVGKLTAFLSALEEQGTVRAISVPRVTVMHNQTALLNVSKSIVLFSLASSTSTATGTATSILTTQETYTRETQSFGTFLPLTVHVADDGQITISVEPRRSQLDSITTSPDGKQTGANSSDQSVSTLVTIKSGQSAIIGGLISDTEGETERGLPGISKVPFLGKVFSTTAKTKTHSELSIIITATEIPAI
jgi:type II secretory pathway component GspD/PulD (secretin)